MVVAGLAALCGLTGYALFSEAAQSHALDARVRSLSSANATLQRQISERQLQIGEAGNVAWLEEQARRLGLVFPGETVFVITTPGHALPAGGGIDAALPTYAPSPISSASPSPSAGASASPSGVATARPSPTPLVFVMPTASPTPH